MKQLIRDIPVNSLPAIIAQMEQPSYRCKQLQQWLYQKVALNWSDMSNLPASFRDSLAESFDLSGMEPIEKQQSTDGTHKFLFKLRDGQTVESVIIPMKNHYTFCISSQVGCAMACSFCATARGGLVRNLTSAEIVEQVIQMQSEIIDKKPKAWNIVFMGMGEPLDNWFNVKSSIETLIDKNGFGISPRRITISTSGHISGMKQLLDFEHAIGLTVSVNSCDDDVRKKLMPIPGRTPLTDILSIAEKYAKRVFGKVTIAYVLIENANDSDADAKSLAKLVRNRPFKINLIPLNNMDNKHKKPQNEKVLRFQSTLDKSGIRSFIRASSGEDIDAACGQLRNKKQS